MANKIEMQGLSELRAALRRLPDDLAEEANVIVTAQAELAKDQVQRAYSRHTVSGNLERGVTLTRQDSRHGVSALIRSRAPHSHLFERGTKPRRTFKGASRGSMPQAPDSDQMVPIIVRRRRAMVEALIALVRRAGLIVEHS